MKRHTNFKKVTTSKVAVFFIIYAYVKTIGLTDIFFLYMSRTDPGEMYRLKHINLIFGHPCNILGALYYGCFQHFLKTKKSFTQKTKVYEKSVKINHSRLKKLKMYTQIHFKIY